MQEARTGAPASHRPDPRRGPRTRTSSWPPRGIARLQEALDDAARMAKRVDRALEEDPFAAALLAREYLSQVEELDVNPLNQQGRTDAWTSTFVRLRVASNRLDRDARRTDGEAYLAARAEQRRLFDLFGSAPHARLTAVRAEGRSKRAQSRAFRAVAWLAMGGALPAIAVAFALGRAWIAAFGALAGVLGAAAGLLMAGVATRASAAATRRAHDLERGISGLALFQTTSGGQAVIERIQREHPLLVRAAAAETTSSWPPSPSGDRVTPSRK